MFQKQHHYQFRITWTWRFKFRAKSNLKKGLIKRLQSLFKRVGLWWDYKHQLPVVEVINLLFFILLFVIVVCKSVFQIVQSVHRTKESLNINFEKYSNFLALMQQSQMDAMNHSDFCVYTLFPVTKCLHMRNFQWFRAIQGVHLNV